MTTLGFREQRILEATISHYIESGEPVGSKTLSSNDNFDVSAATIRNELAKLEHKGYLSQVHTSSGRIPTDLGYRTYVDTLMKVQNPSADQIQELRCLFNSIGHNVHDVLNHLSSIMSGLIDYTTLVVTPTIFQETLKVAHLVLLDIDRILVVLLNSSGLNKEILLNIDHDLTQDQLN